MQHSSRDLVWQEQTQVFGTFKHKWCAAAFIQVWVLECCVLGFAGLTFVPGFGQSHDSPEAVDLNETYFTGFTSILAGQTRGQGGGQSP